MTEQNLPNFHPPGNEDNSLRSHYERHVGNVSDKWSSYLEAYDRFLNPYIERPVRILEIGVQNGGSLDIWSRYFPNAEIIVGCDIEKTCEKLDFQSEKIRLVVADATLPETRDAIKAKSARYDIIIDDGSHRSSDIISCFARYFSLLEDDGLYVVEDLHCSYWKEFQGGIYDPLSSLSFLKRLADVLNHQHWGTDKKRVDAINEFGSEYRVEFDEADLQAIHSIEFLNSLCIIRKSAPEKNDLGKRFVAGTTAQIYPAVLARNGTDIVKRPQPDNPWALTEQTIEAEILSSRETIPRLSLALEAENKATVDLTSKLETAAQTAKDLQVRLDEARQEAVNWQKSFEDERKVVSELQHRLETRRGARADLQRQLNEAREEQNKLKIRLAAQEATLSSQTSTLEQERELRQKAERDVGTLKARLSDARNTINEILTSTSWKITGPLRSIAGGIRSAARRASRTSR